jgi:hypothetical protein
MGVLEKIRDIEAGTFIALLRSDGGVLKLTWLSRDRGGIPSPGGPEAWAQRRHQHCFGRPDSLSTSGGSSKAGAGFDVAKAGFGRAVLIGFPSVGKSTLLSKESRELRAYQPRQYGIR